MTMTKANKQAQEIADLKREVAELKAKVSPPESKFKPMSDAEWIDRMHRMREGRMALATPPSVARYFADGVTAADCADLRQQAHRPTGRPGMIPEQPSNVPRGGNVPGGGTGWSEPIPLSNPPGIGMVDAIVEADTVRQHAELIEREAKFKMMEEMAQQTEVMKKQTEALAKLAEGKK